MIELITGSAIGQVSKIENGFIGISAFLFFLLWCLIWTHSEKTKKIKMLEEKIKKLLEEKT